MKTRMSAKRREIDCLFRSSTGIQILAICLLASILSSCAQTRQSSSASEPPVFNKLELVLSETAPDIEKADSYWEMVDAKTNAGMLGGAAIGAAIATVGCAGPWAPLCFVINGSVGLLAGAFVGGATTYTLSTPGLSKDDSLYFDSRLSQITQDRDLQRELFDDLHLQLPQSVFALQEMPDVRVTARLVQVNIAQLEEEEIQIGLVGWLIFYWETSSNQTVNHTIEFHSLSAVADIDAWLINEGALFEQELSNGLYDMALQMSTALLQQQIGVGSGFSE